MTPHDLAANVFVLREPKLWLLSHFSLRTHAFLFLGKHFTFHVDNDFTAFSASFYDPSPRAGHYSIQADNRTNLW